MFNDQLLSELQEQLELLKQPGPFPVNPVIEKALQLIHQLMEGADGSSGGDSDPRVDQLVETVGSHTAILSAVNIKLEELEQAIGNCTTTEDVQTLIDASLGPINDNIQQLFAKDTELDQRVTALEDNPPGGVSEERVKEIIDEKLVDIKADIHQLKQVDIPGINAEIAALEARVTALEEEPPGEGASKAWVLSQIETEANAIRSSINNLKADLEDKLGRKADKTALNAKADKTELENCKEELENALSEKADKSELESKADKSELESKADKSELESKADKSELETKADKSELESKADKSELETKADKSELESKADKSELESKADKSELESKADKSELESKADKSELESKADKSELETKADKSELESKADKSELESKADKSELESKADKSELESKADKSELESKADKSELETKADKSELEAKADKSELETKADKSELETKADKSELEAKADKSELEAKADKSELETKADKSELETKADKLELETKADKSELETKADKLELETKADKLELEECKEELQSQLGTKADKTELEGARQQLEEQLEGKADRTDLDGKADKSELEECKEELQKQLGTKADKTELEGARQQLEEQLEGKADRTDLDGKADKSELEECKEELQKQLGTKAGKTELEGARQQLEEQLEGKADRTDLDSKADKSELEECKTQLQDQLDTKADKTDLETKADQAALDKLEEEVETIREEWLEDSINNPGGRLARLSLKGCGIVGGFEIFSDDKDYIHITPGIGITPAGELITEPGITATDSDHVSEVEDEDCEDEAEENTDPYDPCQKVQPKNLIFSHCRLFEGAKDYHFFKKPGTDEVHEVWQLLQPSKSLPSDARPLTPQNDAESEYPFITNKVIAVLLVDDAPLYVLMEREDVLEQLCCLPHQCDAEPQYDPDYIFDEDYSMEDNYVTDDELWACLYPSTRLPEIPLFRFGFFTDEDCTPEELDETTFPPTGLVEPTESVKPIDSIDDLYDTWCPIIDDAISRLEKAAKMLISRYHHSLFPLLGQQQIEEVLAMLSNKWTRFKVSNQVPQTAQGELGTKYYAQYFYDWLRDLIAGYHELRWKLIALMNDLRPYTEEMLKRQHRHLLLGMAHQVDSNGLAEPLRDTFHQPPIYNCNAARLEACRLYYRRLFQMIEGFYLPDYAPENKVPGWCFHENEDGEVEETPPNFDCLKITPSKSYIYPLSEQSIPFYYPLLDHPQSLHHYWNYQRSKSRSADRILSYHATDRPPEFPSYSARREVIRPLYYDLDNVDFYRIEGLVGKSTVCLYPRTEDNGHEYDVFDVLQYLVQKHNLDFQVVKMYISQLQNPSGGPNLQYSIGNNVSEENAQGFTEELLGAEHMGGVPKGGAFVVVYDDEEGIVVADFCLPDKLPRKLVDDKTLPSS